MLDFDYLKSICAAQQLPFSPELAEKLDRYAQMLVEWNEKINLTALSLPADCVHGRAEETGRKPEYREQFDLATARAVANLRELAEYCLPFVRVGGVFAALKGYDVDQELDEARYAISQLGGQVEDVRKFRLREDASRAIVLIKKVRPVSAKYPRISPTVVTLPKGTRFITSS